jgi:hypothetical protein
MYEELEKMRKRIRLNQNKQNGTIAESMYVMGQQLQGNKVERTGHGHDFRVTERSYDPMHGFVNKRTKYAEVKSSATAPLSKLQERKKKQMGSKYEVVRPRY